MDIITIGHEAKNAVLQIMQLFFAADCEIHVTSRLVKQDGVYMAKCEIVLGGKRAEGAAETTKTDKLSVTNTIKKSVLYAGKQISSMPTPWGISTGIRPAKGAVKLMDEGKTDEEILSRLKEEYLIEDKKALLTLSVAKREQKILKSMPKNSLSVYVGIPFCPSRCSYCSFISRATEHNNKYTEPYVEALLKEIEYTGKIVKDLNMTVDTVYIGGGTPTAIKPGLLEKIIEKLKDGFDLSKMREFTVEAGRPDTFTKETVNMLKRQEVGRISINPQSMHQKTLDAIGRRHSVEDVKRAFYMAREAGIKSINADLIAGLPDETWEDMAQSVEKVLKLEPGSVTVHTLYMKRAAEMIDKFRRLRFAENTDKMMDTAVKMLTEKGLFPYYMYKQRNTLGNLENVGFASGGHESLYNVYIMEEVQPVIALGAGGSTKMVKDGFIDRTFNPKEAADYTKRIDEVLKRKDKFKEFYEK